MFTLQSPFSPSGDQPQAIAALIKNIESGQKMQGLKGVTGSGKTPISTVSSAATSFVSIS
jgi:excinuclease ABC subunit B